MSTRSQPGPWTSLRRCGFKWLGHHLLPALLWTGGVFLTLTVGLEGALSEALPSLTVPTTGDAFRILPDGKTGILLDNRDRRYFIINLESGAPEAEGTLDFEVADIGLGTMNFVYLVGTLPATGGSGVIARLDVTSGVVVARRVEEQWDAPSLAVAQWAKDIVVGDRRSSTLKGYPAHLFDQDEALLKPSSLVSLGNAGVDELKISADGRYVAAVVGEGSELILVNWITGRVVSSFKLGSDDRATAGSLVNSMKMTMGTGETVNSLRTSVLYSLSPSPQISNTGYFLTFDVNEQFRSLDLVQSVLVKLGEAAGGVQARAVAGRRPVLMVASDEEQKVILVADSTSRRVLRFTRRANEIYPRGEIMIAGAPMDIDVSADGETAVILHQAQPLVSVLSGSRRMVFPAVGGGGGQNCELEEAQLLLARQGYSVGAVDGVAGPQTSDAIRSFQAKAGLGRTGQLDQGTSIALLHEEARIARELTAEMTGDTPITARIYRLERLSFALAELWERTQDATLIDEALVAYKEVADLSEAKGLGKEEEGRIKNNLCFTLAQAGVARKDFKLIDEAIDMCRSSVGQVDASLKPHAQHSLGFALWKRYELAPDPKTLAESKDLIGAAIGAFEKEGDSCTLAEMRSDMAAVEALKPQ